MVEIEIAHHTSGWGSDGLVAALADIAAVGFRGLETDSEVVLSFEDRPLVFNEMLAQHDISFVGVTARLQPLIGADMDEEVERAVNYARFLKATGAKVLTLCVPEGYISPLIEELMPRLLGALDEIGKRTLDLGIITCIHPMVGTLCENSKGIARFMEGTDPSAVFLCPDIGHLAAASVAPERIVTEYASRVRHMHWKDYRPRKTAQKSRGRNVKTEKGKKGAAAAGTEHLRTAFSEIGKGTIDFKKLVGAMNKAGYKGWITMEIEHPTKSPKASAAASFAYAERALDLLI